MANQKNFNHFNEELERTLKAAETGMKKAVTKLEADTKLITHVDTGALRRSWTHKVKSKDGCVEGAVGSNLEYAPYEDDLHGNLSVALAEDNQALIDIIANEIKSGLGG